MASINSDATDSEEFQEDSDGGAVPGPPPTTHRRSTRGLGLPLPIPIAIQQAIVDREESHKEFGIFPCTSFGLDRHSKHPCYFFCEECKRWDQDALANGLGNKKSTSKAYKCSAKQEVSAAFPTYPLQPHNLIKESYVAKTQQNSYDKPYFEASNLCPGDNYDFSNSANSNGWNNEMDNFDEYNNSDSFITVDKSKKNVW